MPAAMLNEAVIETFEFSDSVSLTVTVIKPFG